MSSEEKRIREFAYQIWESEGKPEGHEARHWEMARKLAEAETLALKKSPKAATSKTLDGKAATAKAVNGNSGEPKTKAKAKPPAASTVIPTGEKTTVKKPRTTRKPAV